MTERLTKIFVLLFALLIVASLGAFPATTVADQANQDKTMNFMEQMLPIDLSKYNINLKIDKTCNEIADVYYELNSKNSIVYVDFRIEKGIIAYCRIYPKEGQVITNKQYVNLHDAMTSFLKTYQAYTKIDSNNLIAMLNNADLTKNSTITKENIKLTIKTVSWMGRNETSFRWVQVINGAEYPYFALTFDKDNFILHLVEDDGTLYTIGDTSINISQERAINIAIENLKNYSYEMSDGSTVKDFDVSNYGWIAELVTAPFDYELRPYWDIRIFLKESYPGNVWGITVFIWANTGEIISYSNMATGGINYPDDPVGFSDTETLSSTTTSDITLTIVAIGVVIGVVVASAIGLTVKKKYKHLV